MKKIFLTAGIIITAATVTFAKGHVADADHKEAKKENREIRKEERLNLVSDLTKHQFAEDFPDASKVTYEKTYCRIYRDFFPGTGNWNGFIP